MNPESTPAARLEQFNATYEAAQDRLLLRVRSSDDAEFRFWLTRRYLVMLWPVLMQLAADFTQRLTTTDPLARATQAELAHGNAVAEADFGSAYSDGSIFPLGEEPVLLAQISIRTTQKADAIRTLSLMPLRGRGINLQVDEKLVHVLARLLQEAATVAEWGLELRVAPGTPNAGPAMPQRPRLH